MSKPPAEISYRFYVALDAIEKCLIEVSRRRPELKDDANWFCNELEDVADEVIRVAAEKGWHTAYFDSGFIRFQSDYERFVDRSW